MTTQKTSSLSVRQDRQLIRPNSHSRRFVLAEIVAPRATSERGRAPVHLSLVIDRSGSMSGDKLRVAKSAAEEAIGRLQNGDRFSVIVYDDVVETVIESTHASAESRRAASIACARSTPGAAPICPKGGFAAASSWPVTSSRTVSIGVSS